MGCESSVPKEGVDYTATNRVDAGRGRQSNNASPALATGSSPNAAASSADSKPNNNSGAVNTYYDERDIQDFSNHVKKEQTHQQIEAEKKKKEDEELAEKKKAEDEERKKQQEAEWEAFESEERVNNEQLKSDLQDGKIQENVLTL